jgi:hypothetical protein
VPFISGDTIICVILEILGDTLAQGNQPIKRSPSAFRDRSQKDLKNLQEKTEKGGHENIPGA